MQVLGLTHGSGKSGLVAMLAVGMPVVVFSEGAYLFAAPVNSGKDVGNRQGDIGFYDEDTGSVAQMHHGQGFQIKAGEYVHMFFNAITHGIYALSQKLTFASDRYKIQVEDDKNAHYGEIDIRDKDYNTILHIAFGEDGKTDDNAILNIKIDKDGTLTLKQKQTGEIKFDKDGNMYMSDIQKFTSNAKGDVNVKTQGKFGLTSNDAMKFDAGTADVTVDGNQIKINGKTAITFTAGQEVKIDPAFVTLAEGNQFIALALPLLQLLVSHTHTDPLSGTTGPALLVGDPSSFISKSVKSK